MPRPVSDFPKDLSLYALGADDLAAMGASRCEYEDGEYVIREGERGEDLFVLEQGSIVVEKQGTDAARPLILHATLYQPGQLIAFGEMSHYVGGIRTASVRSTGRSVVLRFPPASFAAIFRNHPGMAERLFRLLGEHLRRTSVELRQLQARFTVPSHQRQAEAGEVLFERGEPAGVLFQCLAGAIRLETLEGVRRTGGEDAATQGLLDLKAYLVGGSHAARAVCETPCLLLAYDAAARTGVLRTFPEAVLRAIAET